MTTHLHWMKWWNKDERRKLERNCKTPVFETMLNVFVLHFSAPVSGRNLQTIWPVFAIQTFTHPERLVLYFLHAKIKRENFAIVHKSQKERIPKKFSIIYPFWIRKATVAKPLVLLTSPIETTTCLWMKTVREKRRGGKERMHFHWQIMWVYRTWRGETGEVVNDGSSFTHTKPPPLGLLPPQVQPTHVAYHHLVVFPPWFYRRVS